MTDQDRVRRNRELLAERLKWPEGALEACYKLESDFPSWSAWWASENLAKGFEAPAGYHARYEAWMPLEMRGRREFGLTPGELAAKLRG